MYKVISTVLVAAGGTLLIFGIRASQSLSSDVSRFFTGNPTNNALWLIIGGSALCIIGLAGFFLDHKVEN